MTMLAVEQNRALVVRSRGEHPETLHQRMLAAREPLELGHPVLNLC